MTKRFDRTTKGDKLHMQSLGALAHLDYRQPANYSCEQAIQVMQRIGLSFKDAEQQVLRAYFNVLRHNCDDHVKSIALLMNRRGDWSLSPAFDVSYAWNPNGQWTSKHQMSINGKRELHNRDDLLNLAIIAGIKKTKAYQLLDRVISVVQRWSDFAEEAGVSEKRCDEIKCQQITEI